MSKYKYPEPEYQAFTPFSGRTTFTVKLSFHQTDGSCPQVVGKAEVAKARAKVRAVHKALGAIGGKTFQQYSLPKDMRREARALYREVLSRGCEFSVGDSLLCEEGPFVEFKGRDVTDETNWTLPTFKNCFKRTLGTYVCGFVNGSILRRAEQHASTLYYGVDDNGYAHGITARTTGVDPSDCNWGSIQQMVRKLFDDLLKRLIPSALCLDVKLQLEPLRALPEDYREAIPFLVIVSIPPYSEIVKSATYKGVHYVRENAATRKATAEEERALASHDLASHEDLASEES